jgi:enediyne polyketide synthase
MDIRSRAESLRPIRYILNHRHRDDDLESAEPGSLSMPPHGNRGKAVGVAAPGSGPIAIVGMGCRFPDADDPATLLDLVLTGRRAFRRLPPSRLELTDYYSADRATPDATYSARAALLEGWQFDLGAFGVPAAVYQAADPAQWLALETTARALAAAGFVMGEGLTRSRTGVIIGNTLTGDASRATAMRLRWPYVRRVLAESLAAGDIPRERAIPVLQHAAQRYLAPFPAITDETLSGSTPAGIASRICGYFGFRGGGYAVDGSHASSLLAVASACTALAAGDLDVALAGGVDLGLDPLELVGLAKTGVLARGDMRVYDESPTGFLPGEGCGMVVLMRSADARLAGLPVYAEIAGWGASSAGPASMVVPDASSQLLAMYRAYERARIAPADVQLIEGHGAGTAAADATELSALAELRSGAGRAAALGSIKANIGNTKAAAGAAGLIKTVLSMSTGIIPPTTGVSRPHPLLRGDVALRLPRAAEPWPDGTRIAGVSGMGPGINVHLVLRSEPTRGRHARRARVAPPSSSSPATAAGPAVKSAKAAPAAGTDADAGATGTRAAAPAAVTPVVRAAAITPAVSGGPPRPYTFLLHAPDRGAMDALLARVAHVAPWLSDAEMGDLACQLGRDAAHQGPVRIALVGTRQDQLARLAGQASALLPGMTDGALVMRPGIFAADGGDGRVTLLISEPGGPGSPFRPLSALRWLDLLGIRTTVAVGFGHSELAGLVWAGCLSETAAAALEAKRKEIVNATAPGREPVPDPASGGSGGSADPAGNAEDRAGQMRQAVRKLAIAAPRHRLISASIGREIATANDVTDLLCADLDCPTGLEHALKAGAIDATLLLETGPGQVLIEAASVLCEVPGVSLGAGSGADAARAAAALFAAGALDQPGRFFAGMPWRSIDIWRDLEFITSPCQAPLLAAAPRSITSGAARRSAADSGQGVVPRADIPAATSLTAAAATAQREAAAARRAPAAGPAAAGHAPAPGHAAAAHTAAAGHTAPAGHAHAAASRTGAAKPATEAGRDADRGPAPDTTMARAADISGRLGAGLAAAPVLGAAPAVSPPDGSDSPAVAEAGPWLRCFAEELRPMLAEAVPSRDDGPWRVRAAVRKAFTPLVHELFLDDPAADCVLAIVGDPVNPDSCAVALGAAQDAIGSGRLVLIAHGPGFTGFCASLHAEHPELGITVLRVPESADGLRAARRFAAAEPGRFREIVIDSAGIPHQAVMMPAATADSAAFPLGPSDVVLVSRSSGAAGLALAQVLACCGAAVAMIGRTGPGATAGLDAGLERLRSAGARVQVDDVDTANVADLRFALEQIEQTLGPVTAVAHAVGVGRRMPLAELTEEELRAQVSAETVNLNDLVSGIMRRQIRLIVTFGSVVGRYGLAGEGLLALASSSLAERAERMADGISGCRAVHVDWPAWSGSGLGQRDSLVEGLTRSGATAIGVPEGSRLLLKTLATPGLPRRVAVHGRVGVPAPAALAAATSLGGRFLENVRVHYPGIELVCEARLTLRTDPYLADHRVDGMPVLPAVMALEAMAEAAAALAGQPLRRLTDVSMAAPVVLPAGSGEAQALIRICALADGTSVTARLLCEDSGFATDHFQATFRPADDAAAPSQAAGLPELDEMPATHTGIVDGTELYGPICFQSGRFRRAALLPEVTSRSCRALVRGGDGQPWFGEPHAGDDTGLILGSPGLNDATWHVLQACVPHRRLMPAGCETVVFSGREADGAVEIRAVEIRPTSLRGAVPGPRAAAAASSPAALVIPPQGGAMAARPSPQSVTYVWDVEAVDAGGRSLVTWRGLRLRDAGPLPRNAAWPPSLLSVYLERSAVALGLHPELRVTAACGLPDGAGLRPAAAGVVPRPSPPSEIAAVPGSGELEGLALSVLAPEAAVCSWTAAVPGPSGEGVPGPGLADLANQVHSLLSEPRAVVSARFRAVAACLAQAGAPAVSAVIAAGTAGAEWLVLSTAGGTLACTVAEISGVSCPVAIAIMTPDAGPGPGRGDAPRGRAERHSVARS